MSDYRTATFALLCSALLVSCAGGEEQASNLDQIEDLESATGELDARVAELEENLAQKDVQLSEIADAVTELEDSTKALREAVEAAGGDMGTVLSPRLQYSAPGVIGPVGSIGAMDGVAEAAAGVEAATEKLKELVPPQ